MSYPSPSTSSFLQSSPSSARTSVMNLDFPASSSLSAWNASATRFVLRVHKHGSSGCGMMPFVARMLSRWSCQRLGTLFILWKTFSVVSTAQSLWCCPGSQAAIQVVGLHTPCRLDVRVEEGRFFASAVNTVFCSFLNSVATESNIRVDAAIVVHAKTSSPCTYVYFKISLHVSGLVGLHTLPSAAVSYTSVHTRLSMMLLGFAALVTVRLAKHIRTTYPWLQAARDDGLIQECLNRACV